MAKASSEGIKLQWLKAFLDVAETGNQTQVAISMGVSQPTISRYIRKLDDWLKYPLFTDRGYSCLTKEGEDFFVNACRIYIDISSFRGKNNPPNDDMNLQWIQAFLEVAKTRSHTEAGINLKMSQSTVSRYIASLSDWTGQKLFHGFVDPEPTDFGLKFLDTAENCFKIICNSQMKIITRKKIVTKRAWESEFKKRSYKLFITLDRLVRKYGPMEGDGQKNYEIMKYFFRNYDYSYQCRIDDEETERKLTRARETGRAIDMEDVFDQRRREGRDHNIPEKYRNKN